MYAALLYLNTYDGDLTNLAPHIVKLTMSLILPVFSFFWLSKNFELLPDIKF
jgi:hypothetical protein